MRRKKYCIDCEIEIKRYNAKRCKSCSHKGKLNINFGGLSENHCKNISKSCKGRPSAFKGKHHTEKAKKQNSRKQKQRFENKENHPFFGKHHTIKTKQKMRKSANGKVLTEDWKRKIRESCQGINQGKNNGMYGKTPRYKKIKYNNAWMRSSYEVNFAYFLDLNEIKWLYESKTFDLGDITYTPDFYILKWNLYIEIKGYWFRGSKKRFDLFKKLYPNIKIKVLNYPKLKQLGIVK